MMNQVDMALRQTRAQPSSEPHEKRSKRKVWGKANPAVAASLTVVDVTMAARGKVERRREVDCGVWWTTVPAKRVTVQAR